MTVAARPPLGVAQHRLELHTEGTFCGGIVVCLGGSDNECQWWCTGDCEQCAPGDHPWQPIAYCRVSEWINARGLDDTYVGDPARPRWDEEHDNQPGIRSGTIETEWTGDDYVWRYPAEAAVTDATERSR